MRREKTRQLLELLAPASAHQFKDNILRYAFDNVGVEHAILLSRYTFDEDEWREKACDLIEKSFTEESVIMCIVVLTDPVYHQLMELSREKLPALLENHIKELIKKGLPPHVPSGKEGGEAAR